MILDASLIDSLVIPWVQDLANGDPTDPALTLTGESLAPSGGWQAGAGVTVYDAGNIFTVNAHYDGIDLTTTVQTTER